MGYKPQRTLYKLNFAETEYAGLEVTVRSPTIQALLDLQDLADLPALSGDQVREMFRGFAQMLISWNVEDDDDTPVPATYEGVITQDPDFIKMIILAWQDNVASAPPPLQTGSPNGGNPQEESLQDHAYESTQARSRLRKYASKIANRAW